MGVGGILVAPAIVRAESIMRIAPLVPYSYGGWQLWEVEGCSSILTITSRGLRPDARDWRPIEIHR